MRPSPIPADRVWAGGVRRVFSAPNGDLTDLDIAPVEVIVDPGLGGVARVNVLMQLEDGDLQRLTDGGAVWLSMLGGLMPFSLTVVGPDGQP